MSGESYFPHLRCTLVWNHPEGGMLSSHMVNNEVFLLNKGLNLIHKGKTSLLLITS